ncbi:hypothetical protein KZJ38_07920 [Paraburkholderia edwinii]|uniref:Uncharacterized protein n=1 Tax=Paraburkholderia edwinii TaxID=2861782 RepID=A0ABX8UMN1_9BURK|nr:hypothetical protein [Paraburkholderia edwinii]QYD70214.1 hypothetical protein KZJ38_07920 [Paraburkholderia edwinii]
MTTSATGSTVAVRPVSSADPDSHQAFDAAPRREPDATRSLRRKRPPHNPHNRQGPPPSLRSAAQLIARGESSAPALTTPQTAVDPLHAPPDSTHPTEAELTSLLARYDKKDANATGDTDNAEWSAQLEQAAMAGYPDDARNFEQDVQRDLGMLAQLPADVATEYREKMKATWDAFESTPNIWQRDQYAHEAGTIRDQIRRDYQEARTDPSERAQAIFNVPFGSDLLGDSAQEDLTELGALKRQFRHANTKVDRESILSAASQIKHSLQDQITSTLKSQIEVHKRAAEASRKEVMQALDEAQGLSGAGATPGNRLEYFTRLISRDEAHARAFTELRDLTAERVEQLQKSDPGRLAQLMAFKPERLQRQLLDWENALLAQDEEAARKLPEVTLDRLKFPSDVRLYVPAPGPNYGEDLRLRYVDVINSIVAAEKRISAAQEPPSSPIRKNYIKTHQSA